MKSTSTPSGGLKRKLGNIPLPAILGALALSGAIVGLALWVKAKSSRTVQTSIPIDWSSIRDNVLDHGVTQWLPPARNLEFKPGFDQVLTREQLLAPPLDAAVSWRQQYPQVRPIPYPYFAGVSLPSDCCGSHMADPYYAHTLLSRHYGLDFPSSFWVFHNCENTHIPSVFAGPSTAPARHLHTLEGDHLDNLCLLLTYYYRGWLDHIHTWSSEAGMFHSLVTPYQPRLPAEKIGPVDLQVGTVGSYAYQGFELQLNVAAGIESFALRLTDGFDQDHWVVFGEPLDNRPGWDVTPLGRDALRSFSVSFLDERNTGGMAQAASKAAPNLKKVSLQVRGQPGPMLQVLSLRTFDISRPLIRQQMAVLRSYNLLPIAATIHGGLSSWTETQPDVHQPIPYTDPLTGHSFTIARPGLGAEPTAPAYLTDLCRDFGMVFFNRTNNRPSNKETDIRRPDQLLSLERFPDGLSYYLSNRIGLHPNEAFPGTSDHFDHFDQLGGCIFRYLQLRPRFGQIWTAYTHFNYFNPRAFQPEARESLQLHQLKRLPHQLTAALELLSLLKYDLDGKTQPHQRLWCVPFSVLLRFSQAQRRLAENTRVADNWVVIEPWTDEVTGQRFPDPRSLTQDLHGQTFYVTDPALARVRCGDREITSLKRNPPDFTGRASVTVVDDSTPTIVLDEVPLQDLGPNRLTSEATVAEVQELAYSGKRTLLLTATAEGQASVQWTPGGLDNHETDFLSFAYRKSNRSSRVYLRWTDDQGMSYEAREGTAPDVQGWEVYPAPADNWREVVLEYADMQPGAAGTKRIPRGRVKRVEIGLRNGSVGDQLWVDRVAFLSARGVRPVTEARTVVIGGRVFPPRDGLPVELTAENGWKRQATTVNGGWFLVQDVPLDTVVRISATVKGKVVFPRRGRSIQASRNSLEHHLYLDD